MNAVAQGLHTYLKTVGGTAVCFSRGVLGLQEGAEGDVFELTDEGLTAYRNQGGCDLLGHSEDNLLQQSDLAACAATAERLHLDGLVVWGGRTGHQWTARLAECFAERGLATCVVGVPGSGEPDFPFMEQALGFDTQCKQLSSVVGNLAAQAASSRKIWFFVRVSGRSPSHLVGEVAMATHPHVVLTAEVIRAENMGLAEVTQTICNAIEARSREDKNYGVVLIPDRILEAIHEMRHMFAEVEQIRQMRPRAFDGILSGAKRDFGPVVECLSPLSRAVFQGMPERTRMQICSHEEVESEVIFKTMVETELMRRVVLGSYKGPFQCTTYSMAYHADAAMPSNFDCDLGHTQGYTAGVLVDGRRSGVLVDVHNLKADVGDWEVGGLPLSALMTFNSPEAGQPPACSILPRAKLVYDLSVEHVLPEIAERTLVSPGPVQFAGPCASLKTQTLSVPQMQRVRQTALTDQRIKELKLRASAGCPVEVLEAVKALLQGGMTLLRPKEAGSGLDDWRR